MASSEPSPAQKRNLELAASGLENWIKGDREAAISTFADDVEVFVPAELGNAGSYRGIEQFRRWFAEWEDAWSEFEMQVVSIEPAGESHVVAVVRSRGVGAGSGIEVANVLGWVIGVRDGRMSFLSLQPDLEAAQRLVAERDPRSGLSPP